MEHRPPPPLGCLNIGNDELLSDAEVKRHHLHQEAMIKGAVVILDETVVRLTFVFTVTRKTRIMLYS